MECLICGIFRRQDVQDVGCLECEMFVMCQSSGMHKSSGMCDVGFLEV